MMEVALLDVLSVNVSGRPATFATAGEAAWKAAVSNAVGDCDVPDGLRFEVEIEFRLPLAVRANDDWDLDNLIKPTLDAGWRVLSVRRRPPTARCGPSAGGRHWR